MSLIIFSHSDYSFLWPIIEESLEKIENIVKLNPIFVSNKTDLIKPSGFTKYIEYNDTLCYAERWTKEILPFIEREYILIVHDVQIIVNCDSNFIKNIIKIMEENNIDRCSMNVFNGLDIIENKDVKLCNLNTARGNTFTPYDVCPTIWKTSSFKTIFETFSNETYRSSELNETLQNFCREKLKCYGLQKTNQKIYYCLGRPFLEYFKILFITIQNEITFPPEVYMDVKDEFLYFFEKYKLSEKINVNRNYGFILDNFKNI
jgi:hypothetical protein